MKHINYPIEEHEIEFLRKKYGYPVSDKFLQEVFPDAVFGEDDTVIVSGKFEDVLIEFEDEIPEDHSLLCIHDNVLYVISNNEVID